MKATVEAVFEDGVFRPVQRPEIPEGEHLLLTLETVARCGRLDVLELAARVYQGLQPEEIDESSESLSTGLGSLTAERVSMVQEGRGHGH